MFGFPLLDVIIGLVFIYALLALICTAANEIYAGLADRRETHLYEGVSNLLGEHPANGKRRIKVPFTLPGTPAGQGPTHPSVVAAFYDHPLIKSLNEKKTRPSYIPDAVFARVILDMFAPTGGQGAPTNKCADFVAGVSSLPDGSDLRRTLLIIAEDAGDDLTKLNAGLVSWFNESMNRVSGWYKNQSQSSLLIISFLVCLALNADTVSIVGELYSSPSKRTVIVAQAEQAGKVFASYTGHKPLGRTQAMEASNKAIEQLKKSGLMFGWEGYTLDPATAGAQGWLDFLLKLVGIVITALAATLGAPFWFDLLGKLVNLRAIGKPPAEQEIKKTAAGTPPAAASPALPVQNPAAVNLDEKSVG
jgi:hypothetical protein